MTRLARGFSLIDVVVGIALMLVVFFALFGILRASLAVSTLAKAKAISTELANTQMEYLRGHAYDSLGTISGIPAGSVPQIATSTIDGVPYTIRTFIEYYDDPADGIGALDANSITTDYKKGKVSVSYALYGLLKTTSLISNFIPPHGEIATNGGALSLHVVDAAGADISGASVQIVNASTTPTVDFTTFTNASGLASIGGAATSSQYQIYVSRSGYSSAQTYARVGQNVNPNPGYLTVTKNLTTSATFAIDRLASLTLTSFSPPVTNVFTDSFTSTSNLASQTNTVVSGGAIELDTDMFSGSARSIPISSTAPTGWGILSATTDATELDTVVVRITDTSGTPLPDGVLPGNNAGFSSFPISLTSIATSSYPGLSLEVSLTRVSTSTAPRLLDWSLSHTEAPALSPNMAFTLTGTKTIGTDPSSLPIYKTVVSDTTGSGASKTETLEWDGYTLSLSANLVESCPASPYSLTPGSATSTAVIVGAATTNTLPVFVTNSTGATVPLAKVILEKPGYAATVFTSACGLAYFNGLAAGTYTATVSAPGYTTGTFSDIEVAGHTATSTLALP
jgi:hypothetical protein